MRTKQRNWLWLTFGLAAVGMAQAQTATETILYNFANFPNGAIPFGTLARDASGNLYGTTYQGGTANLGVVFKYTAAGKYKVLHSFLGGADGANPYSGPAVDSSGNVYGTTYGGGASGQGVVYKVTPAGQETVLYTFTGGPDGGGPYAGVILDSSGNLYGTAYNGGTANAGVVYKLTPAGQESLLYTFTGGGDGAHPYAGVTRDAAGNLYGTTYAGGARSYGVIYRVTPAGQETVLFSFGSVSGSPANPKGGVVLGPSGYLFGASGYVVYKVSETGQYTRLAEWTFLHAGGMATATPVLDSAGNLYGTTGAISPAQGRAPYGSVFELGPGGFKVLYAYPNASAGAACGPGQICAGAPGVVLDSAGNLYGATPWTGYYGGIYKISAAGRATTQYALPPAPGGTYPLGPVIRDAQGNLYGASSRGGTANSGVLYRLDAAGHERGLYSFDGPAGTVIARDSAGSLYACGGTAVYKVTPSGQATALYTFTGGADGSACTGVALGSVGNLYGVGGGGTAPNGLVFELTTAGQFTILHSFTGGSDGSLPTAGLALDSAGDIYGTATEGGAGVGVVYGISSAGQFMVLHTFTGSDGGNPFSGPTRDSSGNLYGTAGNFGPAGGGVVYKVEPSGSFSVLYGFAGGPQGSGPLGGVAIDPAGNIYGTTSYSVGGTGSCGGFGCGILYELDTAGTYTVLHSFAGGTTDGGEPQATVILDSAGNLYGTAPQYGLTDGGVVYRVAPQIAAPSR